MNKHIDSLVKLNKLELYGTLCMKLCCWRTADQKKGINNSLLRKYANDYLQETVKTWKHEKLMQLIDTNYVDYEVEIGEWTLDFHVHAFQEANALQSNFIRVNVEAEESSLFLAALQTGNASAPYDFQSRCFIEDI